MSQIRRLALISLLLFYLIFCCCVFKTSGMDLIHSLYFHQKFHQITGQKNENYMYGLLVLFFSGHALFLLLDCDVYSRKQRKPYQASGVYSCYQTAHASVHCNIHRTQLSRTAGLEETSEAQLSPVCVSREYPDDFSAGEIKMNLSKFLTHFVPPLDRIKSKFTVSVTLLHGKYLS